MFSPVPMKRFRLAVLKSEERAVLTILGETGVVELSRSETDPGIPGLFRGQRTAELASCDALRMRVVDLQRHLGVNRDATDGKPSGEITLTNATCQVAAAEDEWGEVSRTRQHLQERLASLKGDGSVLERYCGNGLPLQDSDGPGELRFFTGTVPLGMLEQLEAMLPQPVLLVALAVIGGRQSLVVIARSSRGAEVENILQRASFAPDLLPRVVGETVDSLQAIRACELQEVSEQLAVVDRDIERLRDRVGRMLCDLVNWLNREHCLLEAAAGLDCTAALVLISGWLPAPRQRDLERRVREVAGEKCVLEMIEPDRSEAEHVPVLLPQEGVLRPFTRLVAAFGMPRYRELAPTVFLALSYPLMFGMMFGDVGQGGLLAAVGGLVLWRASDVRFRDAGLLGLFAGLASVVFGLIYGSCFGLPAFQRFALWKDPLAGDPLGLIHVAVGLGVGIVSTGLVLNMINHLRCGEMFDALCDKFGAAGLWLYWGGLFLVTKSVAINARGLMPLALIGLLGLPLVAVVMKAPFEFWEECCAGKAAASAHGIFGALFEGALAAFEAALSFLANTISFVRLAAYAMSHAAIMLAVITVADVIGSHGVGGGVLGVLVIVLGNVVVLALEGTIAAVQALRLEYYEFFGKFFSAGGRAFRPFILPALAPA